jgi:copper chaperone
MIEFTLPDMTCGHCVKSVAAAVHTVDAQAAVQIDLPAHLLRIESSQAADAFRQVLAAEGYPPAA